MPFDGVSDDVFGDMLRALPTGEVDAVVDDDVAFIGIERTHPGIRVAFTVATRNPWGCALRLGDDDLKRALDDGIAQADLPAAWRGWLPSLPYPSMTSASQLAVEVLELRRAPHDQPCGADSTLSESGNSATSEETRLLIARYANGTSPSLMNWCAMPVPAGKATTSPGTTR